jgi:hypothetical protein
MNVVTTFHRIMLIESIRIDFSKAGSGICFFVNLRERLCQVFNPSPASSEGADPKPAASLPAPATALPVLFHYPLMLTR